MVLVLIFSKRIDMICTRWIPGLDDRGQMKLDESENDAYFLSNGFYRFNGKWNDCEIGYDSVKDLNI